MTIRLKSLQKITELKSKLTLQANWRYAESMRELETEQEHLQQLQQAQTQAAAELHRRTTATAVPAHEVHDWTLFMIAKQRQIEEQHRVIERRQDVCEVKHYELTECYLDEKVWTQLRERKQMEHRTLQNKSAQEMLDEMAVTGYRRIRG